ncbi:MAG TPA: hypothetical protein VMZ11_07270 [Mycobacteriales bacterium]|nr:hypothetical protein [Mycobacteriales bacterium]
MISRRNRTAALVTLLVGLPCAAVAAVTSGSDGVWSALLGIGLVLGFMSAGSLPFVIAGDTREGRGGVAFVVLGLTYALRLVLALVLLKVAARSHVLDRQVIGLTAIVGALAWTGTHVFLGLSRKHAPTLDL